MSVVIRKGSERRREIASISRDSRCLIDLPCLRLSITETRRRNSGEEKTILETVFGAAGQRRHTGGATRDAENGSRIEMLRAGGVDGERRETEEHPLKNDRPQEERGRPCVVPPAATASSSALPSPLPTLSVLLSLSLRSSSRESPWTEFPASSIVACLPRLAFAEPFFSKPASQKTFDPNLAVSCVCRFPRSF